MKTGCFLGFAAGVLIQSTVLAEVVGADSRRDSAVLAAVSGGGVVSPEYDGFTVRTPDRSCVRWTKTYDGYTATVDGRRVHLSRDYDGYRVIGAEVRRVSYTYNGFSVLRERGASVHWAETYDGYSAGQGGRAVRIVNGPTFPPYPTDRRQPKVKRMKNSRPTVFKK